MTARLRPALAAGTLAAALALATTPASADPRPSGWAPVELGTLGGARTTPTAVNDAGQVVGRSQVADGRWHAFLWDRGVMTDLTPDAQDATATDVSNRGHVSGYVQPAPGEASDAFLWRAGTTTVLAETAFALVVNDRGQVGGAVEDATGAANPFVWRAGTRTDVPPPPYPGAWPHASLIDMDDRGAVLARGEYADDTDLAYVWSRGRFTELRDASGTLRATDLNDRGHAAGSVGRSGRLREAALWRDGANVRLGLLPGTTTSQALALNDADLVVGVAEPESGEPGTGFVWQDGVLRPVETTDAWSVASDVNERGQVAGQLGSTTADGVQVAQPYVWRSGTLTPLGAPTPDDVTVVDLSEKGHVLTVTGDFLAERGVLWVPGGRRS